MMAKFASELNLCYLLSAMIYLVVHGYVEAYECMCSFMLCVSSYFPLEV